MPEKVPDSVLEACRGIVFEDIPNLPEADPDWGEPDLTKAEKIFAWTSVIVLAQITGHPDAPTNAVQPEARARLQVRHTVDVPGEDVREVCDIVCQIRDMGLLPEKNAIGVDAAGIGDIVDALTAPDRGIEMEQIIAISQGWKLNGAIKTCERKLAGKEMLHCASPLMSWCAGNAKIVQQGNAISITKQASGTAKIDPLMATFDAVSLLALNPVAKQKREFKLFVM